MGRCSLQLLLRALEDVPQAVARISPLVDYAATLDNTGPVPILVNARIGNVGSHVISSDAASDEETWRAFQANWGRSGKFEAANEF